MVQKCAIGNRYKTYTKKDLGDINNLVFEFLSSETENDSIKLSFILWYCPYYAQIDTVQRKKDCLCDNNYFNYKGKNKSWYL